MITEKTRVSKEFGGAGVRGVKSTPFEGWDRVKTASSRLLLSIFLLINHTTYMNDISQIRISKLHF